VTVVGAGPVGLVLAAELALSGVTVQVLERLAEPDEAMKAGAVNVPTAEALDRRGLLPAAEKVQREILERVGSFARKADDQPPGGGRRAPDARFTGPLRGNDPRRRPVDWSDADLAAHAAVDGARMLAAAWTGGAAGRPCRADSAVPVRRGVEVTALEDTGDGVLVGTTAGTVRTGWLVGCDGRAQRRAPPRGHRLPGTDPELTGHLAVVDIADPEKLGDGWAWSTRGRTAMGHSPGGWSPWKFERHFRRASPTLGFARAGETPMAPVTLEELADQSAPGLGHRRHS